MPFPDCALCGSQCKNDKNGKKQYCLVDESFGGFGLPPAADVERILRQTICKPHAAALHMEPKRNCYRLALDVWNTLKSEQESETIGARKARATTGEALKDVPQSSRRGLPRVSALEALTAGAGPSPATMRRAPQAPNPPTPTMTVPREARPVASSVRVAGGTCLPASDWAARCPTSGACCFRCAHYVRSSAACREQG